MPRQIPQVLAEERKCERVVFRETETHPAIEGPMIAQVEPEVTFALRARLARLETDQSLFVADMDNVTHALAGCLLAEYTLQRIELHCGKQSSGIRRAALAIGVIAAELPDADLVYAGPGLDMGKLGYLLHHRGHTHTVVFALIAAFVVWGIALALSRRLRAPLVRRPMLVLALAASCSHVLFDFTNSYGVHPFWPIDNRWFYGDAVFIVEPWLWIAALGPLILIARSIGGRMIYGVMLVLILGAAWRVGMVPREVAIALTVGAGLWLGLVRVTPAPRRVILGFIAWIGVEAMMFAAAGAAQQAVDREVGPSLRDAVMSAAPGNPLCFDALVVASDGDAYRVRVASIATFPALRDASACARTSRRGEVSTASVREDSSAIRWGQEWTGSLAELRELQGSNCEIAAALRFMRVPVWRSLTNGDVEFSDLRFGQGASSFASLVARRRPERCPRHVPPWDPPRSDLLGATD